VPWRAIQAVQVEPRGAEVHQRIDVVALLQATGRIKSNVMVDELPEVGVPGIDGAVLLIVMQSVRARLVVLVDVFARRDRQRRFSL
jgi:hypothetical protein